MGGYEPAFNKLSEHYEGNGGTALAMMEKTARINISLVTEMDDGLVKAIGAGKLLPEQVQQRLSENSQSKIAVIPNASLLVNTI